MEERLFPYEDTTWGFRCSGCNRVIPREGWYYYYREEVVEDRYHRTSQHPEALPRVACRTCIWLDYITALLLRSPQYGMTIASLGHILEYIGLNLAREGHTLMGDMPHHPPRVSPPTIPRPCPERPEGIAQES